MKTKLQALIAEQKALTAKFEELLNSTTEYSSALDPKKVYIKGHPTRGAEVIKMLEDLGGVNARELRGISEKTRYYIRDDKQIDLSNFDSYTELHLPEEVSAVDPPKEEVELIEGEVYNVYTNIAIFKKQASDLLHTISIYRSNGTLCVDETNGYVIRSKADWIIATPEQRKKLFDALEKAGKHFDKKTMRLLDVEEWSKEHRDYPIICRSSNNMSWSVKLMCEYVNGKALVRTRSAQKQWMLQAIPYNDQTKHLIGKTDSPDKHYKFVTKEIE